MNSTNLLAFTPGIPELIIVLVVILILFGPKKLPDLSRAIGKSIGEFKRGRREVEDELKDLGGEEKLEAEKKSGDGDRS